MPMGFLVLISWKLSLDKHAVVTLLAGLIEQKEPPLRHRRAVQVRAPVQDGDGDEMNGERLVTSS